jgi:hypothetical protein
MLADRVRLCIGTIVSYSIVAVAGRPSSRSGRVNRPSGVVGGNIVRCPFGFALFDLVWTALFHAVCVYSLAHRFASGGSHEEIFCVSDQKYGKTCLCRSVCSWKVILGMEATVSCKNALYIMRLATVIAITLTCDGNVKV